MSRQPDIKISEKQHYAFLHEVGVCALTGTPCEALDVEHLLITDHMLGADIAGMSAKSHYLRTVPYASSLHDERHRMGQETFFRHHEWPMDHIVMGPLALASTLAGFSALNNVRGARNYLLRFAIMRRSIVERINRL